MLLVGQQFSELLVIEPSHDYISPKGQKDVVWKCLCSCGKTTEVRQSKILSKTRPTRSCGCLRAKRLKESPPSITHGESKTLLYGIWRGIKDRCKHHTKKNRNYAGRGIAVCKEWVESYESFRDWAIKNGYRQGLTIDRKDFNGSYCPDNCRFTDWVVQANNKCNNVRLEAWGEIKSLAEWLKDSRCNCSRSTIRSRLKTGWSNEDALSIQPTRKFAGNQHT